MATLRQLKHVIDAFDDEDVMRAEQLGAMIASLSAWGTICPALSPSPLMSAAPVNSALQIR